MYSMSLIIEGMKMPENCHKCILNRGEYGPENYEKCICIITGHGMRKIDYKKRPKDCPLHELNELGKGVSCKNDS